MSTKLITHGRVLEDSYLLGDSIARGQFSTVFKCLYKGKIERACRTYDKTNVNSEKIRKHLDTIIKIAHPNLVKIYESFETEKEIHFIVERMFGEELFERIVELGHYSENEAASLIRDILLALKCLHDCGIPHGDIRPESLVYTSNGSCGYLKLTDVSFSRSLPNNLTVYIAPEKDECPTLPADLWSLGIVVYIMLCGLEPGENDVFSELVPGLKLPWWDDISLEAKYFIQRMLDLDPNIRLSVDEALQVPWISGMKKGRLHLTAAVDRLRVFNARRKFKAASAAIVATRKMTLPLLRK